MKSLGQNRIYNLKNNMGNIFCPERAAKISAKKSSKRELPHRKVCRAKQLFNLDYFRCLVARPLECKFAINFGGAFFCQHQERETIAARTAIKKR